MTRDATTVPEYRSFRNPDVPGLVRLWHECGLGRGAAQPLSCDLFDNSVLAHTYFDRDGLILAMADGRPVGFVHAGFAAAADGQALARRLGVICIVMVCPSHRRRGIGRELVRRAEEYLRLRGAELIQAGPSSPADPFYGGIYGGTQPAGFLESDPLAVPFFQSLDYEPLRRQIILHKDLSQKGEPVHLRMMSARRVTRLVSRPDARPRSWWWTTRLGRLDSLDLELHHKLSGTVVGSATLISLDLYQRAWKTRAIGLTDVEVPEAERRKGYGLTLLTEVARHVRGDMVQVIESHVSEGNAPLQGILQATGYVQVDAGNVFIKKEDPVGLLNRNPYSPAQSPETDPRPV